MSSASLTMEFNLSSTYYSGEIDAPVTSVASVTTATGFACFVLSAHGAVDVLACSIVEG
jgi:hypothetical protein